MAHFKIGLIACIVSFFGAAAMAQSPAADYADYHAQIEQAEKLLAAESFSEALKVYEGVVSQFEFVFLRDCKVAAQLALFTGNSAKSFDYVRLGIRHGWGLKSIKKDEFLKPLQEENEWTLLVDQYDSLHAIYQARISTDLREEVHRMFKKDQWKAIGALFTFGPDGQDRYAEKKFAPHSEKQMTKLNELIGEHGFPGEKLIGNNFWVSTILSHHNAISEAYCRNDTMYRHVKPQLLAAIKSGEMSPFEFALADDWYTTVASGHTEHAYGYLDSLTEPELVKANALRSAIGLRSVETRNKLIDLQQKTGMNFHLPTWPGKNVKIDITGR